MVTFFTHGDVINTQTWEVPPKKSSRATLASRYCPQGNGEAESEVRIAKKILKQRDPFALVGVRSYTPHIHRCKPLSIDERNRHQHPPTYIK